MSGRKKEEGRRKKEEGRRKKERDGTPICSSCGSSACDRRLEGRSRMRREFPRKKEEGRRKKEEGRRKKANPSARGMIRVLRPAHLRAGLFLCNMTATCSTIPNERGPLVS